MQSLREKLLKAGLVTEEATKKSELEASKKQPPGAQDPGHRPRPPPRHDGPPRKESPQRASPPSDEERMRIRIPKLPPLQGSKESHRLAARKQLELDRHLRELVLASTVALEPGPTPFYFVTRKNKLRRLELTNEQAKQLEQGALAVVERPDPDKIEHALVTAAAAEELLKLSERAVRFLNKEGAQVGFLSDEEIHRRAEEANAQHPPIDPIGESEQGHPLRESEPEEEAPTFITIKRAPLP